MAAPSPSAIRSALRVPASSSRSCMRWASAKPARALPPCASAAAWASPCASNGRNKNKRIPSLQHEEERGNMGRVAVVTGGTRGIGAAISKALQQEGHKVVASYAGNDEAAQKFKTETGIAVRKWDVGNYEACASNLTAIEAELGPVGILVNNAGITKDGMFHKMTREQWYQVIDTNLNSL